MKFDIKFLTILRSDVKMEKGCLVLPRGASELCQSLIQGAHSLISVAE